jgi:hypothetical protein
MKTRDFFKYTARPFNIFILLCVLIFITAFLEIMSVQIFVSLTQQDKPPKHQGRQWDIHNSNKEFTPDGGLLLTEEKDKKIKIYDANDTKLWEGDKKDRPKEHKTIIWASGGQHTITNMSLVQTQRLTLEMSRALEIPIRQDKKIREIWRYLPDEDIFVGYKFKSEKIGYIGANGFSQSQAESKAFGDFDYSSVYVPENSENPVLLWKTKKQFFAIDFENSKTAILVDGSDANISKIQYQNWSYDGKKPVDANYRTMLKYCTNDETIHLTLSPSDEKITIKIPKQWDDYLKSYINITATKDTIFIMHDTSDVLKPADYDKDHRIKDKFNGTRPFEKAVNFSTELYKVDKTGNLSLANKFQWTKPAYIGQVRKDHEYYLHYASVFSPPVFYYGSKIIENLPKDIDEFFPRDNNDGMMRGYISLIRCFRPRMEGVCIAISVVMMLIVLWHGWSRKNNRFSLALWVILVGLFNIAGLLTYLALNHTTLLKCPACGKQRNLEKPACIHCRAGLPLPSASMVRIK